MTDASRPPGPPSTSGNAAAGGNPSAPSKQLSSQQHRAAAPRNVRVAVLTISDTRTPETDTSGQYLLAELKAGGHSVVHYRVVRDDALDIRTALVLFVREATVVLTTGGTGLTGRDVTVPVVESMITKPIPGFGELFRMLSYREVGGAAMLSRALGGLCRGSAIFAMPGSLNAVKTAWEGILKNEIGHLAFEIERHGQPGVVQPGVVAPALSPLSQSLAAAAGKPPPTTDPLTPPMTPTLSPAAAAVEGTGTADPAQPQSRGPGNLMGRLGRHKKEDPRL
ncbi:molybdenum cofactor biosynthesis protein B [Deinococcus sp. AJ005]|uniref:MogA/MoaB family molybdenum cofactor biosynthesis protein n=1 Tax=Deinococcus sp. AJ005 TaxID=2652443 RepID=UPI00125CC188|nr:molybdenum cofactor biosynthesis protein B [Deinococcus sp. AJ005]QFP76971.1 molybdenum cofactor biosynthesis protein MoaB [Deinococcus sp. AJ005]